MKVKISTKRSGYGKFGSVVEVDEIRGARWIAEGIAEPVGRKKRSADGDGDGDSTGGSDPDGGGAKK